MQVLTHTKSSTISWILFLAPSTQSLDPLITTLSLLTPLRGKLTVTPPNSSAMCFRTSPRRATKYLWCFESTWISPSTTLSWSKSDKVIIEINYNHYHQQDTQNGWNEMPWDYRVSTFLNQVQILTPFLAPSWSQRPKWILWLNLNQSMFLYLYDN